MGKASMATPKKKKNTTASKENKDKKKSLPKAGKKSGKTKKTAAKPFNQGLLSLLLLFALVLVLGLLAHFYLKPVEVPSGRDARTEVKKELPVKRAGKEKPSARTEVAKLPEKERRSPSGPVSSPKETPVYELPVLEDPVIKRDPIPKVSSGKPKVALILDDIGYDAAFADKMMQLGIPVTFSVLPGSPHGAEIAEKAHKKGFEILLHQPMEPEEYPRVNPGTGVILMKMGADEAIAVLEKNLQSLPQVKGVNNHMGSRLTRSEKHMNQIFSVLKREDLFFIDSLTSSQSLGKASARLLQLPFARRDVFLDHIQTREFVEKQTSQLIRISQKYGSAIGIGHPYPVTLEVLRKRIPKEKEKVDFVFASELVEVMAD